MIPRNSILEWAECAPWPEAVQVEQDLIISRALVSIFRDPFLSERLAFRGGTALNKLFFAAPFRYSEDIDLVQVSADPIGPVLDALRRALDWLPRGRSEIKTNAAKLRYQVEGAGGDPIRLKIEINTREHGSLDGYAMRRFEVGNRWFSGDAEIRTFKAEEMLGTKLRALLQREKGRDLFDLERALTEFPDLDLDLLVDNFAGYLKKSDTIITRAMAEERLLAKLRRRDNVLADMRPLVPAARAGLVDEAAAMRASATVLTRLIRRIEGDEWENTQGSIDELGLRPYVEAVPADDAAPAP